MKPGTTDLTLEFTDEEYALACKLAGERNITVEEFDTRYFGDKFLNKAAKRRLTGLTPKKCFLTSKHTIRWLMQSNL
jgi:hypothetical protein